VQEPIVRLGMIPANGRTPEQLAAFIAGETACWGALVGQTSLAGLE
jgi:hypothetical protein